MAIVTTYVCDVSGKQGTNKSEFVSVLIKATAYEGNGATKYGGSAGSGKSVERLLAKEVALKLGLLELPKDEVPAPEVTFESKLTTLLKDYINELVYDSVADATSN